MMDIQIFKENGWEVRTVTKDGELWFVAKDVAENIGYKWSGSATIRHLPKMWTGVDSIPTPNGRQTMTIISEQGLYFFLGRSDKKDAVKYQMWISGDVVPSIRKHGGYLHTTPEDSPEMIMAKAIKLADAKIKQLENTVAKAAPAVDFRNYATNNGTQWTITDAKNELEIGLTELQTMLMMVGFFRTRKFPNRNRYWPKDKYIDCGYCIEIQDGPNYAFTAKGMRFLNTLVYDGIVKAEAMFENDRKPDLFEEEE